MTAFRGFEMVTDVVSDAADVVDGAGTDLGRRFATALVGRQVPVLTELLAPDVDFRGLTPGRAWEATDATGVIGILFGSWFEPADVVEELISVTVSSVADRQHISYRLRGHDDDGPFVVEQQMYYMITNDPDTDRPRISWMRVLCSGFRTPLD